MTAAVALLGWLLAGVGSVTAQGTAGPSWTRGGPSPDSSVTTTGLPDTPPLQSVPADFQPKQILVLATSRIIDTQDIQVVVELARNAAEWARVVILVAGEDARERMSFLLSRARVDPAGIELLIAPHDSPWIRDYGPLCAWRRHTGAVFVDFLYSQPDWMTPNGRVKDDRIPAILGRNLDVRVARSPIDLEGGNFVTNGQGVAVATNVLLSRNAEMGLEPGMVLHHLHRNLGIEQLVVVPRLLDEPAGHVDVFATFVSPHVALVSAIDPQVDPENARRLDETARILAGIRSRGRAIEVHRLPMPLRDRGRWRTYTNVVYLNGAVFVPSYHDVDPVVEDAVAETYRRLLPGWKIIPIECTGPMNFFGALRCLSLPLPYIVQDRSVKPGFLKPTTTLGPTPAIRADRPQSRQ